MIHVLKKNFPKTKEKRRIVNSASQKDTERPSPYVISAQPIYQNIRKKSLPRLSLGSAAARAKQQFSEFIMHGDRSMLARYGPFSVIYLFFSKSKRQRKKKVHFLPSTIVGSFLDA